MGERRGTVWAAVLLVVLAALGLVGCGGDDDDTEGAPEEGAPEEVEDLTGQAEVEVDVVDNAYAPVAGAVDAGTVVTFSNVGRNEHNVTPVEDGAFEPITTEELQPGDSGTVTFEEPGIYAYYCTIHGTPTAGQRGTITVVDPASGAGG